MKIESSDTFTARPSRKRRTIALISSILLLLAVVLFLGAEEDTVDVAPSDNDPALRSVSIEEVRRGEHPIEVRALAEIQPKWSTDIRASVAGKVVHIYPQALAGNTVKEGEPLVEFEDDQYRAEFADTKRSLQEARLEQWRAKNAVLVAKKEFERSDVKPPNDLALKLPQLDIANAAVEAAQARVSHSERLFKETLVHAPFAGVVTERYVNPGQAVNPGDRLLSIVDNNNFELTVSLSEDMWKKVKKPVAGLTANLIDKEQRIIGKAVVRQGGGFLDIRTRQHKVFLEVDGKRENNLVVGDFVTVALPGRTVTEALNVPASALTQEGYIWYTDAENRLRRFAPDLFFRKQDRLIISSPDVEGAVHVAIIPLASFLPGEEVSPVTGGDS